MAKTNWVVNDQVTAADMNALGVEINRGLGILSTARSAAFCYELCSSSASYAANQQFQLRRLLKLSVKPTRFRIHFRNRNQLGDGSPTGVVGTVQNLTVVIGKPAVDATTGEPTGAWAAAPTSVMASTTMASETELITPWIDYATYGIDPDVMNMIGYSFMASSTANGQIVNCGGLSWQSFATADLTTLAPTLTRANNASFLQVIVEYEHLDANAKNLLIVGNSLSGASAATGMDNYGEIGTYHQRWATRKRGCAASIAVAGSYAGHYNGANGRWNLFDTFNIPIVFDMILFFAANSSDLAGGSGAAQTSTDAKTATIGMIKYARTKFPATKRLVVTDIPPRVAFTGGASGTNEYERINNLNRWMHMLPVQVEACLDINSLFSNWATPERLRPIYTTDDTHLNMDGHARASDLIHL